MHRFNFGTGSCQQFKKFSYLSKLVCFKEIPNFCCNTEFPAQIHSYDGSNVFKIIMIINLVWFIHSFPPQHDNIRFIYAKFLRSQEGGRFPLGSRSRTFICALYTFPHCKNTVTFILD